MDLTYAFIFGWILLLAILVSGCFVLIQRRTIWYSPFFVSAFFGVYGLMTQLLMFSTQNVELQWEVLRADGIMAPVPTNSSGSDFVPLLNGNHSALWPALCLFFAVLGVALMVVKFIRYVIHLAKFKDEHMSAKAPEFARS